MNESQVLGCGYKGSLQFGLTQKPGHEKCNYKPIAKYLTKSLQKKESLTPLLVCLLESDNSAFALLSLEQLHVHFRSKLRERVHSRLVDKRIRWCEQELCSLVSKFWKKD